MGTTTFYILVWSRFLCKFTNQLFEHLRTAHVSFKRRCKFVQISVWKLQYFVYLNSLLITMLKYTKWTICNDNVKLHNENLADFIACCLTLLIGFGVIIGAPSKVMTLCVTSQYVLVLLIKQLILKRLFDSITNTG